MAESRWDKWKRNGRLATIALVIFWIFWFFYNKTTPKIDRDPIVGQALWLMMGAWVANIAYGVQKAQQKKDEGREQRTVDAEGRASAAESKALEAENKVEEAIQATRSGENSD